jgi:TetR/AcrR family transcriptional regulator, mexJK operon transcriptional repressor
MAGPVAHSAPREGSGRRSVGPVRADKRRVILDAAAPIFGDHGFERASIDAIAAAAGVSKPTIYAYFGGKDQLFRDSVADTAAERSQDALRAILRLSLDPDRWRDTLHEVGVELVQCSQNACGLRLSRMIAAEAARDPAIFEAVRTSSIDPVYEALAGRLAMVGNAGYLTIDDPALAARQFIALIGAELPELTRFGTQPAVEPALRDAVAAGVDTFLRANAIHPSGAEPANESHKHTNRS